MNKKKTNDIKHNPYIAPLSQNKKKPVFYEKNPNSIDFESL